MDEGAVRPTEVCSPALCGPPGSAGTHACNGSTGTDTYRHSTDSTPGRIAGGGGSLLPIAYSLSVQQALASAGTILWAFGCSGASAQSSARGRPPYIGGRSDYPPCCTMKVVAYSEGFRRDQSMVSSVAASCRNIAS